MRSVLGHNTLLYTTPQQCGNISYCEVWLFFCNFDRYSKLAVEPLNSLCLLTQEICIEANVAQLMCDPE